MNIIKLRRRPRQFKRLIGLEVAEFDRLLVEVERVYPLHHHARLSQRPAQAPRLRAVGGGRAFALSVEQRLLATLLYFRLHVTEALLSCLFEIDQSNLCRERNGRMMPVLQTVLPTPMRDHLLSALEDKPTGGGGGGGKRIGTLKELLEAYPELRELCVDGTEQEVPKPQNKRDKKHFYSGKSHCHTVKTQVTTARRLVLHAVGGCPGSVADRQLLKASGVLRAVSQASSPIKVKAQRGQRPAKPTRRRVRLDRGYSGMDKNGRPEKSEYGSLPGVEILAAIKGGGRVKVTALGKAWNRAMVSPQRMQVEQNIGHLKNWRVLSGLYRAEVARHASTFSVVAGLHNFTILGDLNW